MRKLLILQLLLLTFGLQAQVIYEEKFNAVPLTSGAATIPLPMVQLRGDHFHALNKHYNFPFNQPGYDTCAWALRTFNGDTVAAATGLYDTIGFTQRWLITPPINVSGSYPKLRFFAMGYSPYSGNLCGSLEVRISTASSPSPQPSDFTTSLANVNPEIDGGIYYSYDLSSFTGQTVRIGFRWVTGYLSNHNGSVLLDDILVSNNPTDYDGMCSIANIETYLYPGQHDTLSLKISNGGMQPITSLQLHYRLDLGPIQHASFIPATALAPHTSVYFKFPQPVSSLISGLHRIQIWCDSVNGYSSPDAFRDDDSAIVLFRVVSNSAPKNVLLEEYTGAWCGDCPTGGHEIELLAATNPSLIPVSIHGGDSMVVPFCSEAFRYSYSWAAPVAVFDRHRRDTDPYYLFSDLYPQRWYSDFLDRDSAAAAASVNITNLAYNISSRLLTYNVSVNFITDADGPFAINTLLTEHDVTGPPGDTSDNHWNNHSYLDNDTSSPYFGMGNLLDASEYQHNFVLDTMLSEIWGDTGSIPQHVLAGQTFTRSYSCVLPVQPGLARRWKPNDIKVVAYLTITDDQPLSSRVINAGQWDVMAAVSQTEWRDEIRIYPAPARETVSIELPENVSGPLQIDVYDISGRSIISKTEPGNRCVLDVVAFTPGIYSLKVTCGTKLFTAKLPVIR